MKWLPVRNRGELWIILPQRRRVSKRCHLECVQLKARWIMGSWSAQPTLPWWWWWSPQHCHGSIFIRLSLFMRPMSITGVINYYLSVVQGSKGRCVRPPLYTLARKTLLYQTSSNVISKDLYQIFILLLLSLVDFIEMEMIPFVHLLWGEKGIHFILHMQLSRKL